MVSHRLVYVGHSLYLAINIQVDWISKLVCVQTFGPSPYRDQHFCWPLKKIYGENSFKCVQIWHMIRVYYGEPLLSVIC